MDNHNKCTDFYLALRAKYHCLENHEESAIGCHQGSFFMLIKQLFNVHI